MLAPSAEGRKNARISFCKGLPGRVAAQISRCARLRASSRCARLRRRARGPAGEDPASFGLGSLSGSTLAALKLNRSRTRTRYAPHRVLSQTSHFSSGRTTHVETPNEPLSALRIHGITRISSEHSQSHTHTGSHILSRGDSRHTGEGEGERAGAGAGAAAAAAEQRPLAAVAAPSVPERRLRGVRVRRGGKRGGAGTRGCGGEQAKDPCAVRRPARGRRVAGQGSSPHPTRRFERVEGTPAQGPQGDQW